MTATFDGRTIEHEHDHVRLTRLLDRVIDLMKDEKYRTIDEIKAVTGGSECSLTARLRDLRKAKFGKHTVNRRRRGEPGDGLHEYQLILREKPIRVLEELMVNGGEA